LSTNAAFGLSTASLSSQVLDDNHARRDNRLPSLFKAERVRKVFEFRV